MKRGIVIFATSGLLSLAGSPNASQAQGQAAGSAIYQRAGCVACHGLDARGTKLAPQIGALLPCNVVVRTDEAGKTMVEIMDPRAVLQLVEGPEIAQIAGEVRARLERVLAAV
jgi:mono/diheme cytochrome c family protein